MEQSLENSSCDSGDYQFTQLEKKKKKKEKKSTCCISALISKENIRFYGENGLQIIPYLF